jgi:hypothetical protein
VQKLLGKVIKSFGIEIIQRGDVGDSDDGEDDAYLQHSSLRVRELAIVNHIYIQGSFPRDCYQRLVEADQHEVVEDIAKYTMTLVTGLKYVKAERDAANLQWRRTRRLCCPLSCSSCAMDCSSTRFSTRPGRTSRSFGPTRAPTRLRQSTATFSSCTTPTLSFAARSTATPPRRHSTMSGPVIRNV